MRRSGWLVALCFSIGLWPVVCAQEQIILPASDFINALPKGDIIADATTLGVPWLFNNTSVVMKSESNLALEVFVREPGRYNLFVRSHGKEGSSFQVGVGNELSTAIFGDSSCSWKPGGGFDLVKGKVKVKITRIQPGASFDLIVLTKASTINDDVRKLELNPDVKLLTEYTIPDNTAVKFGDVNGDGRTDMLVLSPDFSSTLIDNSGKILWSWQSPEPYTKERSGFEAPGLIWDFNNDGRGEVVHWRMSADGMEQLAISNGATGAIISSTAWPTRSHPHVYNNFRLAIAKLTTGAPNEIIAFTDMGSTIRVDAYDHRLKSLWTYTKELKKDHLGHYIYPVDLTNDGIDEVLAGCVLLDRSGNVVWDRFDYFTDHHDHADSHKFQDLDGDGIKEIITANSETGVFVFNSDNGKIRWHDVAEHVQQIQGGMFLEGVDKPQVVVGARTYGNRSIGEPYLSAQLFWFTHNGEFIKKWPSTPVNGNPDFVKGLWNGKTEQLFWYKFQINSKGVGELYFPDPVYHMFDFNGDGTEDVITLNRNSLKVFGSKNAPVPGKDLKADPLYRKNNVTNHTHY
jgi:hypothetical protein